MCYGSYMVLQQISKDTVVEGKKKKTTQYGTWSNKHGNTMVSFPKNMGTSFCNGKKTMIIKL